MGGEDDSTKNRPPTTCHSRKSVPFRMDGTQSSQELLLLHPTEQESHGAGLHPHMGQGTD